MGRYSVTIDAGHGGKRNTGATFSNTIEKDRNLIIAFAVGMKLKQMNVDVHFTRLNDTNVTIQQRVNMSEAANTDMLVSFHRYGRGNTGVGVIIGNGALTGIITETSEGKIMRLPRPEYEKKLGEKIIAQFRKVWNLSCQDREVIIEGRDTKLKNLGLFSQQRIQKPTFIIELGSVKHRDNDFINSNFDDIVAAAAHGIYDALEENSRQVAKREPDERLQTEFLPDITNEQFMYR
jgi:N-acetylmuramoyl-L-alanine amidase